MPASNSEARKRHDEAVTVTDIIRCPVAHHDTGQRCTHPHGAGHPGPHCGGDLCWPAIARHIVTAMQTRAAEMWAHGHEPTVHTLRRAAMRAAGEVMWRTSDSEWHCALDVEVKRILGGRS